MLTKFLIAQSLEDPMTFQIIGLYHTADDEDAVATRHILAYHEVCDDWFALHGHFLIFDEQLQTEPFDGGIVAMLSITFIDPNKAMLFKLSFVKIDCAPLAFAA